MNLVHAEIAQERNGQGVCCVNMPYVDGDVDVENSLDVSIMDIGISSHLLSVVLV
jgi:hypothetical protein